MRSIVLTCALLLGTTVAWPQAVPPTQQSPPDNSQIPGEPGTPPTFPRTQIPPDQPSPPAQLPEQPGQQTPAEQQSNAVANATPITIEGCLNGSDGSFTLTDENRGTFQLIGADRNLAPHVGHSVRVTGTPSNIAGAAVEQPPVSGKAEEAETETTNPSADVGQQTLNVSTVQMISDRCNDVPKR